MVPLLGAGQPGTDATSQWGVQLDAGWDGRDTPGAPTTGYRIEGGAGFYAAPSDSEEGFGFTRAEAATYLSPGGGNPTLALRVGGKKLWGDFPYYEAAFLGGGSTVRGLHEERFAGDAAVYGSVELRAFLARLTFLLPVDIGVFAFGDVGRVFFDGEPATNGIRAVVAALRSLP